MVHSWCKTLIVTAFTLQYDFTKVTHYKSRDIVTLVKSYWDIVSAFVVSDFALMFIYFPPVFSDADLISICMHSSNHVFVIYILLYQLLFVL